MNRPRLRAAEAWERNVEEMQSWLMSKGHAPLEAFELAKRIIAERRRRNPSIDPEPTGDSNG